MKQISLLLKLFKSTNADGSPSILRISHFEDNNGSSAELSPQTTDNPLVRIVYY